jgi:hypothetical protein
VLFGFATPGKRCAHSVDLVLCPFSSGSTGVFAPFGVERAMGGSRKKLKIFDAVVGLVAIYMVNMLVWRQHAPNMSGHNKAVLKNISFFHSHWMIRHSQLNIAKAIKSSPIALAFAASTRDFSMFFRSFVYASRHKATPFVSLNQYVGGGM